MAFLELRKISFVYPGEKKAAVEDIDLIFEKHGVTAIVGANGSGKTTLTKLMTGILVPTSGEIRLGNRDLNKYSLAQIGRRIGYVFQNPDKQLFCNSVEEEIVFGLESMGADPAAVNQRVRFYLDYFELSTYRKAFPQYLSQGEKQRVAIAAVLAGQPEFLILDEPTSGLDAYRKKLLKDYLQKITGLGTGMALVSHDSGFVKKIAQRMVSMEKGRIVKIW